MRCLFLPIESWFFISRQVKQHTGEVTYKEVITETSPRRRDTQTGIRERTTQDFFNLRLSGLAQTLQTYNIDENYSSIEGALAVGDQVTVFYDESIIYKIEKNGVFILDDKGKRLGYKIGGLIAGLAAAFLFWKAFSLLRQGI